MVALLLEAGLRYDEEVIPPGAQTERRGDAGPVRVLLRGGHAPAHFSKVTLVRTEIKVKEFGEVCPIPLSGRPFSTGQRFDDVLSDQIIHQAVVKRVADRVPPDFVTERESSHHVIGACIKDPSNLRRWRSSQPWD
jgi:hypothetical protein